MKVTKDYPPPQPIPVFPPNILYFDFASILIQLARNMRKYSELKKRDFLQQNGRGGGGGGDSYEKHLVQRILEIRV